MAPIEIGEYLVEVDVGAIDRYNITVDLSIHRGGEFVEEKELTFSLVEQWSHEKTETYTPGDND